ncbi:MAG: sugar isomerase [Lachnospiraceae bacterium]|jgi:6-phospho-3-hexuloisomerase|nr:sugar isomerase [Lachnospiraceae bacterium]
MEQDFAAAYKETEAAVLKELTRTLDSIDPASLEKLKNDILSADQVFFVGVGRVMLSLESICKRFSHLGIRAHCVGDITEPHLNPEDLLIVGSGSGTTLFPLAIAKKARETVGCRIAHIGSAVNSPVDDYADYLVRIPVRTKLYLEDEIDSCQPMTTLFDQSLLLVGDILAKMIIDEKHLDMKSLWQYHANME